MKRILYAALLMITSVAFVQAQTYPVVWTNATKVTVNGDNSLTRTGTAGVWDAGIVGQNAILSGQDGSVQFTYAGGTVNQYIVSLSRFNVDPSYAVSDYSLNVNGATLYAYNAATNLGSHGALVAGDILKIAREGLAIKFYKNNTTLLRTITLTANTDNLRVDVSIATGSVPIITTSFMPALMVKPQFQYPSLANNDGSISLSLEGQYNPVTYSWTGAATATTASITAKPRTTAAQYYTVAVTDAQSRTVTRNYGLGYPITWTNLTNISINGDNSLTKTDAVGWTAGTSSLNVLPANTDGWIEFVVNEASSNYMIGLSRIDKNADYVGINYAWYVTSNGTYNIYELGTSRGVFGSIMKGDVIRISREGTNIKYYLNNITTPIRTVASVPVTLSFVVDVSIHNNFGPTPVISASFDKKIRVLPSMTLPNSSNQAGSIALSIQGADAPSPISWTPGGETSNLITSKARGKYTVTITDAASRTFTRAYQLGYPVCWTDFQNLQMNANYSLTKSAVTTAWDAGAISSNTLPPSTDGWIEFTLPDRNSVVSIGLSTLNSSVVNTSINYAFQFNTTAATVGDVNVYELTSNKGVVGNQAEGDVYTIAREGTSIKYYINGVVVKTTTVASIATLQLVADVAIYSGSTPVVTSSFSRTPQPFYAITNGLWNSPATWSLSEGGTATTMYPGNSDTAIVKGYTVTVSTGINCAGVNITASNDNTNVSIDGAAGILNVKGNVVVKGENNINTAKALTVQNSGTFNVVP